jgi:hypothetical protein
MFLEIKREKYCVRYAIITWAVKTLSNASFLWHEFQFNSGTLKSLYVFFYTNQVIMQNNCYFFFMINKLLQHELYDHFKLKPTVPLRTIFRFICKSNSLEISIYQIKMRVENEFFTLLYNLKVSRCHFLRISL